MDRRTARPRHRPELPRPQQFSQLLGSAGALGAALIGEGFGRIIAHHGYLIPFLICGVLHLASLGILHALVRRIEPVALESPA